METTLVTLGVVAVMAGIVGGGLKALGTEVPLIASPIRQVLLAGFGVVLIVAGLFEPWDLPPVEDDRAERQTERTALAVPATQLWTRTGVDLEVGDELQISAEGVMRDDVQNHPGRMLGPDGVPDPENKHPGDPFKDQGVGHGALVGRIGEGGEVFGVGSDLGCSVRKSGRLFLGINDGRLDDNDGQYDVKITVVRARDGHSPASSRTCTQA